MPANTPGYNLPYLLGTDPNDTIDTGFQNLAEGIETVLKSTGTYPLVRTATDGTGTTVSKSGGSYTSTGVSVSIVVGASGIVVVHQWALVSTASTSVACQVSFSASGAKTVSAGSVRGGIISRNVDRHTGSDTYVLTGCTPGGTLTVTNQYAASTGGTTVSVFENTLTLFTLG